MFELVEIDPVTGDEDQLIATGSFRRMSAMMAEMIEETSVTDYDHEGAHYWAWLRVQPAA